MTAIGYSLVVLATCWLRPDIAPRATVAGDDRNGADALLQIWPVLVLILLVFGGLFSGLFTATEAVA